MAWHLFIKTPQYLSAYSHFSELTKAKAKHPEFPDNHAEAGMIIAEEKAELDCALQSDALEHIWNMDKPLQEVVINSAEPYDIEGVEEYGNLLNNWESEYKRRS